MRRTTSTKEVLAFEAEKEKCHTRVFAFLGGTALVLMVLGSVPENMGRPTLRRLPRRQWRMYQRRKP